MTRTERESDSRRREVADFLVLARSAKSLQNGVGFSGLGRLKRKGWPQCHRESSWIEQCHREKRNWFCYPSEKSEGEHKQ